jgi:hypothetical protein
MSVQPESITLKLGAFQPKKLLAYDKSVLANPGLSGYTIGCSILR